MARLAMRIKAKKRPKFKTRKYNRCPQCGRSRAYLRKFDMCRLCFRKLALAGMVPGVIKASW
ncbi:MAG: type Z 30S ribosomal protein S14 [Deltaproteobacteria bacterium]|nr:type Z 30S ribosomal protein S14 [Deltaproteobacteria bacterium]